MNKGATFNRLSFELMTRVCRDIYSNGNESSHALSLRHDVDVAVVRRFLHKMHEHGHIHISDWSRKGNKGVWFPLYSWEGAADAPYPGVKKQTHLKARVKPSLLNRSSTIAYVSLISEIKAGPCSTSALSESTGLARHQISNLMTHGRRAGFFRVAAWEQRTATNGEPVRLWEIGSARGASRPKPLTESERNRAYRERRKRREALETITQAGAFSVFNVAAIAQASNYQEAA